jgi:hypothetical protein
MEMKPIFLPPKGAFSFELLKETNYLAWERVQRLLDSLQQELFGYEDSQTFQSDLTKMLDAGFLYPDVNIDPITNDATVKFLMWPYLSREYKHIEDMEDDEFDVVNGILEYFARTN